MFDRITFQGMILNDDFDFVVLAFYCLLHSEKDNRYHLIRPLPLPYRKSSSGENMSALWRQVIILYRDINKRQ